MKIILAPDKFKNSLSAFEACQAMRDGIFRVVPGAEVILHPLADGGEGTAEVLVHHSGGGFIEVEVFDPLFRKIKARYGLSQDASTAYIEMAEASGLHLLKPHERNCMHTSTFGTGQLVLNAIHKGVKRIILCIGGSATNDAGMGMMAALGCRFLDRSGHELPPTGEHLIKVNSIDHSQFNALALPEVWLACDVINPLYGPEGAAYVYGPQKGASPTEVELLDEGLQQWAAIINNTFSSTVEQQPGAGAAGGLGACALAFFEATPKRGIDLVMELTQFKNQLPAVNLVITGEGKLDAQTLKGKVVEGVAKAAQEHHIHVAALCGILEATPEQINHLGLLYASSITSGPCTLEEAQANAYTLLKNHTTQVLQLFIAGLNS